MLDLGWTELLIIGVVALIVVGPKDLPGMFRAVGQFVGKAKGMARDFSRAMNDAADESGVNEIQKSFKTASNPMKTAMNELKKTTQDATKDVEKAARPPLDPERQAMADRIEEKASEMAEARRAAASASDLQPLEPERDTGAADGDADARPKDGTGDKA